MLEFTDYRELIGLGRVDGVIVSTPNACHFEQCRFALENGVHVLVDKPLTITAAEASELVHLSRERELVLMTAFTRHFMGSTEFVRERISAGDLGTLKMITAVQCRHPHQQPPTNGGMLLCRAVHIVDVCTWLADLPVTQVEAQIEYGPDGRETFADIRMQLGQAVPVRLICIQDSDLYQDEVTVYGTKQSFRLKRPRLLACDRAGSWSEVTDLPVCSNSTAYFVDTLRGQVPDQERALADLHSADGLRALQVLEAAVKSARTGDCIELLP